MISSKERILQKVGLFLYGTFGVSPNGLSMVRIFGTPWVALLVTESIKRHSAVLAILTIVSYVAVVLTDLVDGPLARAIAADPDSTRDVGYGGALDRISDKLLIVFSLIPFGTNPYIVAIIIGESILLHQALFAKTTKAKQATYIGKIKMVLQTFLMPIILLGVFAGGSSNTVSLGITAYAALTTLFTFLSVLSHYRVRVAV